jgi:hypothetical protein
MDPPARHLSADRPISTLTRPPRQDYAARCCERLHWLRELHLPELSPDMPKLAVRALRALAAHLVQEAEILRRMAHEALTRA